MLPWGLFTRKISPLWAVSGKPVNNSGDTVENAPANPLFTDLTAAKVVWLLVIAAFTLAVVIRGLRRKKCPRETIRQPRPPRKIRMVKRF